MFCYFDFICLHVGSNLSLIFMYSVSEEEKDKDVVDYTMGDTCEGGGGVRGRWDEALPPSTWTTRRIRRSGKEDMELAHVEAGGILLPVKLYI